ncbi:hypothetical protein OKJ48_00190 [Streptomyces kunmingensis]|uniref:Uncharacterized protein n=1 Tax=Streptomyces kunmingensis TaxID=68225 RepID=A0ABU6C4C2_9ACTN|nr:hypothetical protein [Streptomyces kunmingensis]MEB3958685.1 hypothetical protein [Streptomyces kunmingensis]
MERGNEEEPIFRVVRKETMSKKGWTNCRPLSAFCPDGLLHPQLARADYAGLDRVTPLAELARARGTNVTRFLRTTSRTHGLWSLAGPDRAITAVPLAEAAAGISEIITRHEEAVVRTLPRAQDQGPALRRLRHLMPDPDAGHTLLDYFRTCMERALDLVGARSEVLSAARDLLTGDGGKLLPIFRSGSSHAVDAYNTAARLQGSRSLSPDHPLPYYVVDLRDGRRLPMDHGTTVGRHQIIAPKILAMEGVTNMALPVATASRSTIRAREIAYRELHSGSSQTFYDTNWLQALAGCRVEVAVHDLFRPFVKGRATAPLEDLAEALLRVGPPAPGQPDVWNRWAAAETLKDLATWHYPLLMWAVAGEGWLAQLKILQYATYADAIPA